MEGIKYLLAFSSILFMMTRTSDAISVDLDHNSKIPTPTSPPRLPPRILRSTPSPPPPPQRNTPSDTTPTRILRSTPSPPPPPEGNTPSDTTPTRILRAKPSPPPPPQGNTPSDTTPTRMLRAKPSPPPPPHRNTPTNRLLSSTPSETASFHSTPGSIQLDGLDDNLYSRSKHQADPKLKRLCAHTDYPSLCLSSLSPSLAGAKSFSLTTALRAAIQAATSHARLAVAAATRLSASRDTSEDDKEGLGTCKEAYGDALDNLQAAAEATPSKDIGTVNSMLSAVITDSENCGDALDGMEAGTTMSKYDDKLRKLASNGLAIASLIN